MSDVPPPKLDPSQLSLRATPRPVTRLSRRALVVLTTIVADALSEPAPPGVGRVKVAATLLASAMDPPFSVSAVVEDASSKVALFGDATV